MRRQSKGDKIADLQELVSCALRRLSEQPSGNGILRRELRDPQKRTQLT
jgi:hypothetical protein